MHPNNIMDIVGAILFIALIATILTKKNTANDVATTGRAFDSALSTAERG